MTPASTGKPDANGGSSSAARPGDRLPDRPLILGHRGFSRRATENTLRAFDLALRAGADGVELDVRPARDGIAVILHDDELDRTMQVKGRVSRLDAAAIQRMTHAQVPLLSEAAAWGAASGAWINFELKAPGVEEAVRREIERTGIDDRSIVSSFDADVVRTFRDLRPDLLRFLITREWDAEAEASAQRSTVHGICLGADAATQPTLDAIRGQGYHTVVWTVNRPEEVMRLARAGVAGIISDDPAMAARALGETAG